MSRQAIILSSISLAVLLFLWINQATLSVGDPRSWVPTSWGQARVPLSQEDQLQREREQVMERAWRKMNKIVHDEIHDSQEGIHIAIDRQMEQTQIRLEELLRASKLQEFDQGETWMTNLMGTISQQVTEDLANGLQEGCDELLQDQYESLQAAAQTKNNTNYGADEMKLVANQFIAEFKTQIDHETDQVVRTQVPRRSVIVAKHALEKELKRHTHHSYTVQTKQGELYKLKKSTTQHVTSKRSKSRHKEALEMNDDMWER